MALGMHIASVTLNATVVMTLLTASLMTGSVTTPRQSLIIKLIDQTSRTYVPLLAYLRNDVNFLGTGMYRAFAIIS